MPPEQSKKLTASTLLFGAAGVLLYLFAGFELFYHTAHFFDKGAILVRVLLLCIICLLFYLAAQLSTPRAMRCVMWLCFALYVYLLLTLTLFDPSLGRAKVADNGRAYYMQYYVNFIPTRSIYTVYIKGFLNGYVNSFYMLLNLLGNICAFMPLALFLPLFFKAQRNSFVFLATVMLAVGAVEALQLCFMVGSCDIDDLILNAGGALLLHAILKAALMQRLISRLTCGAFHAS